MKAYKKILRQAAMEPKTANIIDEEEIDDVSRDEINHYSASVPCQENVTQVMVE